MLSGQLFLMTYPMSASIGEHLRLCPPLFSFSLVSLLFPLSQVGPHFIPVPTMNLGTQPRSTFGKKSTDPASSPPRTNTVP